MAIAISPTPILRKKDANEFTKKVLSGLQKPVKLVPTPKIENARKMVMKYVSRNKK